MKGMSYKVFNDAIHGNMAFHPLLVKIIDTREFSRLRNLKQTGPAYYVYPTASHNRFEHSLGTCYLAGKLLDSLILADMPPEERPSRKEKLCVQIAGLCHDLGHGPFSHTWDIFLRKAGVQWKHEEASVGFLNKILKTDEMQMELKKENMTEDDYQFIRDLINVPENLRPPNKYYLYQIISNTDNDVDVDKWDYLLRDAKQLNLSNSFDPNRLLNYCQVLRVKRQGDEFDRTEICFRDKEVRNILDMLITRASLHDKAYQHRIVKIIEIMIVDAFLAANKACPEWNLTDTSTDHMLTLTDSIFYQIINSNDERLHKARDLLIRVETRKLYTCLHQHICVDSDILCSNLSIHEIFNEVKKIEEKIHFAINKNSYIDREDIEVAIITIDMGSKYKEDWSNYYTYEKNSQTPKPFCAQAHIMAKSLKRLLRRELLVLYKGNDVAAVESAKESTKGFFSLRGNGTSKQEKEEPIEAPVVKNEVT